MLIIRAVGGGIANPAALDGYGSVEIINGGDINSSLESGVGVGSVVRERGRGLFEKTVDEGVNVGIGIGIGIGRMGGWGIEIWNWISGGHDWIEEGCCWR